MTKQTTTTFEYDEDGRVVKQTVVEYDDTAVLSNPTLHPYIYPTPQPYAYPYTVTHCGSSTATAPDRLRTAILNNIHASAGGLA